MFGKFVKMVSEPWSEAGRGHRETFSVQDIQTSADEQPKTRMALYHYRGCPFCSMVQSVIEQLGTDVEMRDIYENSQHFDDLIDARGRATVPVLRISTEDDDDTWLPESRDITSYLQQGYG